MGYDYKGKLVLVTGASSGLGWYLTRAYHEAGARLALVARRTERMDAQARELDSQGKDVRFFTADLQDTVGIPALVDRITEVFNQPIDVLVNNAGMSCYGEIERCPYEVIEQTTTLNYLSGVRLAQTVLEPMKRQKSGQIVWIGSGSAFRGIPRATAYSASKAAAKCFCEALRNEVNDFGLDVLLVIPGALKTDFHHQQPNYSSDQRLRSIGSPAAPHALARKIVSAGRRRKSLLIYGRYAWIGQHLAYWAPWLLDRLFRRQS